MQLELPTLNIPPSTPIISGHFPMQELGILEEEEEEVLDISMLTFNQVQCKIMQEKRRCYAKNPTKPILVVTKKEIVINTTMNLEMIVYVGTAFVTAMELNINKLNKENVDLKEKLAASKQKVLQLQSENQTLLASCSLLILGRIGCALALKFCGGARMHEISRT